MSFICNFDNRSTFAYKFSVYSKSDPDFVALKQLVKANNERCRDYARRSGRVDDYFKLQRIRLMARGPRKIWSIQDYNCKGAYQSYLPHKYAEYFDVYVDEDVEARADLIREINDGMTKTQYNRIRELEMQANQLRREAEERVRTRAA